MNCIHGFKWDGTCSTPERPDLREPEDNSYAVYMGFMDIMNFRTSWLGHPSNQKREFLDAMPSPNRFIRMAWEEK